MQQPKTDTILALDPGSNFGWAVYYKGKLQQAGGCTMKAWYSQKLSAQAIRNGHALPPTTFEEKITLLGELPCYFYHGASGNKGNPNDLIKLGVSLGELLGVYRRFADIVELHTAHDWKGSVDKDICHRRIENKVLTPEELKVFPKNPHGRDAVGYGAWYLGRYR